MEKTTLEHVQPPEMAAQREQQLALGPWYRKAARTVITPDQEAEPELRNGDT
jgi:hypothetical protein